MNELKFNKVNTDYEIIDDSFVVGWFLWDNCIKV